MKSNDGLPWRANLILMLAYFAAAQAGHLMASHHNETTSLWPAAGLALAGVLVWGNRLWPGVWLGAFLFELWLAPSISAVTTAGLVATGAALQALLGARLTRRLLTTDAPLTREGDIAYLLLLGGPLSCLVSASFNTVALYTTGEATAGQAVTQWLMWWSSNSLGVLLFMPLLLAWPRAGDFWPQSGIRITLPLLITAALLVSGDLILDNLEAHRAKEESERLMEEVYDSGFRQLPQIIAPLHGVARFFAHSDKVTREEYATFATYIAKQPWVVSVDWAPRVTGEERAAFEQAQHREGREGFALYDLDAHGEPFPSARREVYFPVTMSEPFHATPLGLDHGFEKQRQEAMSRALASGRIALTTGSLGMQHRALLAFLPVYRSDLLSDMASEEIPPEALRGFVVATYDLEQLFANLSRIALTHRLLYRITDVTAGQEPQFLLGTLHADTKSAWTRRVNFADRLWQLQMQPASGYWQPGTSIPSRLYLAFSVLAAFQLAFAVLSAAGRNASTTREVHARTADLAYELAARRIAEKEIRRLNLDLERKVEERTLALEALHTKEEELSAIVDNLPYALINIDSRGVVHSANPALQQVLGYRPEEVIGRNIAMLMPEPNRNRHGSYIAGYLQRHTGGRFANFSREVKGLHKDGRLIPLEITVNEFQVRGEHFYIGSLNDISERQRFIDELTRARMDAEQASQAKSAFLAIMSHEIRTPMNGVIGLVDVLAHSRLTEYQTELLNTISESATTLLHIIDDILDFSKIDAGRMTIEHNPVRIADLVEGLCTALYPEAASKEVELSLFVSPEIPEWVLSDTVRLRQILFNLIGNAIKFSANQPGRKGSVSIRVEAEEAEPLRLRFRIIDNGIGMNRETVDKLFTPFTQAEASTTRRFGGTGLGLAIARRLTELMQGSITVQSSPGAGSTFTVTMPFAIAEHQATRYAQELSGITCIMLENPGFDSADLSAYLVHAGAQVLAAADPHSAAQTAVGESAPVVAIQYIGEGRAEVDEALASIPKLRHLLITRGRRQRGREDIRDVVTLDYPLLRRQPLLEAVAIAAGRVNPPTGRNLPSIPEGREPRPLHPSVEEARAENRLILIAEDDKLNQRVILQQLAVLGYAAEIAGNGAHALSLWRNGNYALLITDLYMPDMDGYTLARQIRQEEARTGRRMPILAFTASVLAGEAERVSEAGMDGYLTKPAQLSQLRNLLERWLPQSSAPPTAAATTRPAAGTLALDVGVLHDMVGDDPAIVFGLLSEYRESVRHLAEQLRDFQEAGDFNQICALTHRLKSSSRVVGAMEVGNLCETLEKSGKARDLTAIDKTMPQLQAALEAVESELTRLLAAGN